MRILPYLAIALLMAIMLGLTGCTTSESTSGGTATGSGRTVRGPDGRSLRQIAAEVEARYVVGPSAARSLGYRVDWQVRTDPSGNTQVVRIDVQDDAVFTLDGHNILSRFKRSDGARIWRMPVADAVDEVLGITYLPPLNRVLVTTGGHLYVLDATTGSILEKQPLEKVAATAPFIYGQFMIYGSRDGQLVWHNYAIAFHWRSYQIAQSVQLAPVFTNGYMVTVGNAGQVYVISADTAQQLWSNSMLDRVVARPAAGRGVVYVTSLDQHIRAFDLITGRKHWETLTTSPLRDSPLLLGDRLYVHVPTEGLHCFEALPRNSRRGVIVWTAEDVHGTIVTRRSHNLLVWDPEERVMTQVEAVGGAVAGQTSLSAVTSLTSGSLVDGDLFAVGDDGRVVRLVPITRGASATARSGSP